ncbi:putative transcription factor interactor and regulator CCHC(Zn) family [Helianthus annuus]|uniref:Transcription factor interactor and regulator CCHC(Zn) family n=1 Tax=Helianthus annuus TaxID=4232 RepID=A0A9K3HBT6_HELAN|nr:putative transcription factor interactor and regulator CCHC(Zn) family [Helianthus annuus]KAJ0850773.1 putative transcription factor interactor and regulator CCHC(Zn) family [Helianthus annuus]
MYKAEKMMITLLQQAIKEDIFILLQHDGTSRSIWDALKVKFEGSEKMIKSKKALLKKEFDLFSSLSGESSKKLIERYCHLVRSMSLLGIEKSQDEWIDKLADALPQKEWGTYLMILKNTGEYDNLTISQFIEKIEGQDLEQQNIARMNNPSGQQDVKMYYKGNVQVVELSPKVQTDFSAQNSSGSVNQSSNNSSGFSTYPSVNPKSSTSSHQFQSSNSNNGQVLHCNIALHLQNGQNFSEEIAKSHMSLLATVLESYERLVAGRIENPMLTKEDYDQIDAEEMELMDIKWCLASVLRRAKKFKMITGRNDFLDANVSTLGFDKSKVTCFRCREKGHFKRECKNQEASGAKNPFGSNDYYRKAIYQQITHQPHQQKEPQTAHAKMIEDANKKAYFGIIDQDDEKVAAGFSSDKYIPPNSKVVALIAQTVQKPDLMTEWLKVFASNESSQEEESVSSDDNSEKTTVFDQSSTDDSSDDEEEMHINIEKTHLSPESFQFYFAERIEKLKEKQATKNQKEVKCESVDQEEKNVEVKVTEKTVEVEKIVEIEKIVEVIKPCLKCLESCKQCAEKDEKLSELDKMKEKLLFDLNYVKESYDVLNRTVTALQKTNSEREDALTMMNAVMMSKQKAINFYIEESAKRKQELETEKIENERIRRLLQSYSSSDYLIDRIYPTVAGLETFQDEKPKKKDTGKKQSVSYNKCPPPIWEGYSPRKPNEEQVKKAVNIKLKSETTDELPENIDVTFTSSDIDHESELIKKGGRSCVG